LDHLIGCQCYVALHFPVDRTREQYPAETRLHDGVQRGKDGKIIGTKSYPSMKWHPNFESRRGLISTSEFCISLSIIATILLTSYSSNKRNPNLVSRCGSIWASEFGIYFNQCNDFADKLPSNKRHPNLESRRASIATSRTGSTSSEKNSRVCENNIRTAEAKVSVHDAAILKNLSSSSHTVERPGCSY
jgi:hypothetical protein